MISFLTGICCAAVFAFAALIVYDTAAVTMLERTDGISVLAGEMMPAGAE